MLPDEYASVVKALNSADILYQRGLFDDADQAYKRAWSAGRGLESKLTAEQLKRSRELQSRTEAELLNVARQRAILEDQRRLTWEEQIGRAPESEADDMADDTGKTKPRPQKEPPAVTSYTVKRGESLPQIAARAEVYGDSQLWPLLYRSNRDQISDPRRIWPGQVLRIPRNSSADDLAEARRFAQRNAYF